MASFPVGWPSWCATKSIRYLRPILPAKNRLFVDSIPYVDKKYPNLAGWLPPSRQNKALDLDPVYEVALINKEMCMKFMVEGQSLIPDNTDEVKYYRDYGAGKKSYIESFINVWFFLIES